MYKILVNNYVNREKLVTILAESGYTVKVIELERKREFNKSDFFVIIVDEPELPEYQENVRTLRPKPSEYYIG